VDRPKGLRCKADTLVRGLVVRLSVHLAVGRRGFDSLAESDKKTLKKLVFTASLLDVQH